MIKTPVGSSKISVSQTGLLESEPAGLLLWSSPGVPARICCLADCVRMCV